MDSLTTLAGALSYAMGIEPPACAEAKNEALAKYVDEAFGGRKAALAKAKNVSCLAVQVKAKSQAGKANYRVTDVLRYQ